MKMDNYNEKLKLINSKIDSIEDGIENITKNKDDNKDQKINIDVLKSQLDYINNTRNIN